MGEGYEQVIYRSYNINQQEKVFNIFGKLGNVIKTAMSSLSIKFAKTNKSHILQYSVGQVKGKKAISLTDEKSTE